MNLACQILAAVALDVLLGDPRWLPHPVRGIGRLAQRLEPAMRRTIRSERTAGVAAVLLVTGVAGAGVMGAIRLAGLFHPSAADIVSLVAIYTSIAARDLARHSLAVYRALEVGDLTLARRRVAWMVGRDTERLDEAGVVRATVECVAESTVDGVVAPLFFAMLAGPVGAMVYRAVNTLDSTFGYKTERYVRFGWASARLDDLANWLPARVAAPLIGVAAALLGRHPGRAWRILRRDGRKHESPNAGLPEAAMAGALGVQLGGVNEYDGEPLEKALIGDPDRPLAPARIPEANGLMFAALALFLALGLAVRAGLTHLWLRHVA